MTRYRITVGRRIYQTTTMVVTEESLKKAEAAAIDMSKEPNIAWDNAEDADTAVYFIDDAVAET